MISKRIDRREPGVAICLTRSPYATVAGSQPYPGSQPEPGWMWETMPKDDRLYHNHFRVPYLTKSRMNRVREFWELVDAEYNILIYSSIHIPKVMRTSR